MFSSIYVAGQIIDMEIGFGLVNILDPQIMYSTNYGEFSIYIDAAYIFND